MNIFFCLSFYNSFQGIARNSVELEHVIFFDKTFKNKKYRHAQHNIQQTCCLYTFFDGIQNALVDFIPEKVVRMSLDGWLSGYVLDFGLKNKICQ